MKENWDAKLMAHLFLTGSGGLLAILLSIAGPRLAIAATSLFSSAASFGLAANYGKRRDLGAGATLAATTDLLGDYWAMFQSAPTLDPTEVVLQRVMARDRSHYESDTSSFDWYNKRFITTNIAIIGAPGSGKSVNARYLVDRIVQAYGLEAIYGLLSSHFESEPEDPLDRWLPGVPREEMAPIVSREKEENWARLASFYELMRERRQNEDTTAPLRWLIIDDFQYQFPKDKRQDAAELIESLVDEGRKYNVRIVLILHSGKTKQVKFDSGVLWSMTAIIFKNALSDPNSKSLWPDDIQSGRAELIQQITGEANAIGGNAHYRVVVVRPGAMPLDWERAQVKLLPDRATCGISFKVAEAPWLDTVTPIVLDAISAGEVRSFTAACRYAGVANVMQRDKKTGHYRDERVSALWDWWDEQEFSNLLQETKS